MLCCHALHKMMCRRGRAEGAGGKCSWREVLSDVKYLPCMEVEEKSLVFSLLYLCKKDWPCSASITQLLSSPVAAGASVLNPSSVVPFYPA